VPAPHQVQSLLRASRQLTAAAAVLTAIGVVLGGIWAQQQLGRFWSWDAKETGAAIVVLWDAAMLVVLGKRLLGDHAALTLGLAGNAVVASAWFGPHVLGLGLHAYGWPALALPLGAFLLAQIVLACLSFVPAGMLSRRVRQS
jgi:ABC-type transport system involved in cytochrome c biogenesis permease subunit